MADQDWYTTFFYGASLQAWHNLCPDEFTVQETEWIMAFLDNEHSDTGAPLRVLDVPCGNARHVIALAQQGHTVTGIDIAPENISIGKHELAKRKLQAELVQADARTANLGTGYDAVICLGNSLGYFPISETRDFVIKLGNALKVGGRLFVSTGMLAESILPNLEQNDWYPAGDMYMLLQNEYVLEDSRLDTTITFLQPGKPADVRQLHHYVFTFGQLREWLEAGGLEIEHAADGPAGDPYQFGSEGLYLVAKKIK